MMALNGLVAMSASADALKVFSPGEVRDAISAADVQSRRQHIDSLGQSRDASAVLQYLGELESAPRAHPAGQAYLIHYGLMRLADMPATDGARALLRPYLAAAATVGVWEEDGHYKLATEAFDPGAAARFALGRWNQAAWSRRVSDDLDRGSTSFLAAWVDADAQADGGLLPTGVLEALGAARVEALLPLRQPLASYLASGERVGAIAALVAARTGDPELAVTTIRHAPTRDALRMLEAARDAFGQTERLHLLREAAGRSDLGSAAMYGLGELENPDAHRELLANLGNVDLGSSAAAALARKANPALIREVAELVRHGSDLRTKERAVLALQLSPAALARPALDELARDARVSPDLQARIARRLP